MTTSPPLDLTTHHPTHRAEALTRYADHQDATGHPGSARLARLAADTERLLADPTAEPATVDDPAWEEDDWWTLASTHDRPHRAELLERIWRDWALPHFGDDADIILQIARSERAAHALATQPTEILGTIHATDHNSDTADDIDTILAEEHAALIVDLDHTLDADAGLEDLYGRASRAEAAHEPDCADADTSIRVRPRWVGNAILGVLFPAGFAMVAIPAVPWECKVVAAVGLVSMVFLWLAGFWRGLGR